MFAYIFLFATVLTFFEILEIYREFWRKAEKKDKHNLPLCMFVGI